MKREVVISFATCAMVCSKVSAGHQILQPDAAGVVTNLSTQSWSDAGRLLAEYARKALCPIQVPNAFTVEYVDDGPSIEVGSGRGYRIVLSEIVAKDLTDPHPSPIRPPPAIRVKEYIEFVVFPTGQPIPADAQIIIPWSGFTSFYHVQSVDMGSGLGFHWFGRMHLWEQDDLRERLGLEGGDDRNRLARQALSIKDEGRMTANSMAGRMDRFKTREKSNEPIERNR